MYSHGRQYVWMLERENKMRYSRTHSYISVTYSVSINRDIIVFKKQLPSPSRTARPTLPTSRSSESSTTLVTARASKDALLSTKTSPSMMSMFRSAKTALRSTEPAPATMIFRAAESPASVMAMLGTTWSSKATPKTALVILLLVFMMLEFS
ncbi:hypothetical protein N431DRAFT_226352 [Stipitochalara longipes BDJ]|nr:hypothetical protein N431DRAFT_226352 [Stipitochalara longipes BDJ]